MAGVTARTANWRLFGGSALVIAGIMMVIGHYAGPLPLLVPLGYLVLAAGFVILAFGQTGGNGVVGKDVLGKVALVVYAAGWVILALSHLGLLPTGTLVLAVLFVIVAGPLSAWIIYKRAIPKGAARWIMFLPTLLAAIWALSSVTPGLSLPVWIWVILALLFATTGALYLLNNRKLG